jgi:putative hemolysin
VGATLESIRFLSISPGDYALRLARCGEEIRQVQALRFEVFNLELKEGLEASHATGLDEDHLDSVCDHLLVEHRASGRVVGTYRLQSGMAAEENRGYYCEAEFDFQPFEATRGQMIELGRACVHRQHRNPMVLGLLWKGIADYARERNGRYLVGCSSLSSQDPAVGASAYADLCRRHLAPQSWRTKPLASFECPLSQLAAEPVPIPKLLRAYLTLGAQICGPPALDRNFKTIDFLTMLDLQTLHPMIRQKFFGPSRAK